MKYLKYVTSSYIYVFLMLLISFSLNSQDISIESENATTISGVTNGGMIRLDFHPNIYPVFIQYSIPGGGMLSLQLNSGSYVIPDIIEDVGNYRFSITSRFETSEECCTDFDVFISHCYKFANQEVFICTAKDLGVIQEPGGNNGGVLFGDGNISDDGLIDFTIYSALSSQEIENMISVIKNEASYSTDEIIDFGTTEKLISEQDEVTSDKDLVFKFDEKGNMLWVYKSKIAKSFNDNEFKAEVKENNEEDKVVEKVKQEIKSDKNISSIQLFPNPFRSNLNVKFYSNIAQEITIRLINTNGQRIVEKRVQVMEGNNKINLFDSGVNVNGLYFLQVIESSGNMITKQVVKIK